MENYLQLIGDAHSTCSLLVMASASDVREAVRYLKRKPEGLTSIEVMANARKRLFEPTKVIAYELWGIIERINDRLKLTPLGWELARSLTPEARIFRSMIDNVTPYRNVLAWILQEKLALVTYMDVIEYWQQHYPQALPEEDEKTLESCVVSFFYLCQAADVGMATIGRKGQPTRLQIYEDELSDYLRTGDADNAIATHSIRPKTSSFRPPLSTTGVKTPSPIDPSLFRLLISHDSETSIAEDLQEMVQLIGIDSEIIERRRSNKSPLSEDTMEAMRRNVAAIIIVSANDTYNNHEGKTVIKEAVLVEIGAAYVHFDHRVHLLWDNKIPLPDNLSSLTCSEFSGAALTCWDVGLRLIKTIKDFEGSYQQGVLKQPLSASVAAEVSSKIQATSTHN